MCLNGSCGSLLLCIHLHNPDCGRNPHKTGPARPAASVLAPALHSAQSSPSSQPPSTLRWSPTPTLSQSDGRAFGRSCTSTLAVCSLSLPLACSACSSLLCHFVVLSLCHHPQVSFFCFLSNSPQYVHTAIHNVFTVGLRMQSTAKPASRALWERNPGSGLNLAQVASNRMT